MRHRIARVLCVTASDWRLLLGASLLQVLTACALRTMPLPALRRRAARLRPVAVFILDGVDERVIWAIEASGRRLGRLSTCLVRAIVADLRLGTPERPLRLTIGVKRARAGDLQAHAWLGDRDRIVVGGSTADEYLPMLAWDSVRP
jgi:hypothetical protein